MENRFYTYAYLTETGKPYYIGKGSGRRAWRHTNPYDVPQPADEFILILKKDLTEDEAWDHEEYMIAIHPNLQNKARGGRNVGCTATTERKRKIGKANRGRCLTEEHKRKLSVAKKGKKQSPEDVAKRAEGCRRSISIEKDGAVFDFNSSNECAEFLGVHHSSVSNLRTGKSLTCRGFKLHFNY